MAKRGNGEGSISKRSGGGWMAQYYVLSGTGGRERRTLYAKTRTEAARKLARAIGERDTGFVVDAGRLTVGDYLERWLEDSVKETVRVSTYETYRYMVGPHLVPFLGALKLRDINPVHVRALYREKLEAGLSAATVRKMHAVLSKAMKQAVLDGLIHRSVCDSVRPPRLTRKEIRPAEAHVFRASARPEVTHPDRDFGLFVGAFAHRTSLPLSYLQPFLYAMASKQQPKIFSEVGRVSILLSVPL